PNTFSSKVLQDIVQHISINDTPERYLHSNQTPHRSASLLTPPSSEERPLIQSLPAENSVASNATEPSVKVSLAEKIMAQSALYSQAIQKQQQQQHSTSSTIAPPKNANFISSVVNPRPRPSTHKGPSPTFTFHRLQQKQQQFLTRNSVKEEHENPHDEEHDKPIAPSDLSIALTAVELPVIDEEPSQHDDERELSNRGVERSKPAAPIPKPDPLDNPL
ncbi:6817_t:CDS:1, partial [Acaulospora colombiana]